MISQRKLRTAYIISDYVTTLAALTLFNAWRHILGLSMGADSISHFLKYPKVMEGELFFPAGMLFVYYLSGYYNDPLHRSRMHDLSSSFLSALIGSGVFFMIALINDMLPIRSLNYEVLTGLFLLLFVLVFIGRSLITAYVVHNIRTGRISFPAVIIGTGHAARKLAARVSDTQASGGMRLVGFVSLDDNTGGEPDVYPFSQLENLCKELDLKYLILSPHHDGMKSTLDLISKLFRLEVPILMETGPFHLVMARSQLSNVIGEPLVDLTHPAMSYSTANIKRFSDIIVSALALIAVSPIIALTAIAVKLDSRGPVIYRQKRVGRHKKQFTMYKIRSMCVDAEHNNEPCLTSADDKRVTRVGRFIRKYRIDELPQFWNVLKGDMSIVGPRPERAYFIEQIVARVPYYSLIHQVRPGITSWGMVKFGYASNVDEMIERLNYDLLYLDNISLSVDMKIIFHTVSTVLKGKGK